MTGTLATIDMFSTKGAEYLIVIAFLLALIPIWLFLTRPVAVARVREGGRRALGWATDWFRVPEGVYFHPGHTWAVPTGGDVVRVGLDDFAQSLLGTPTKVHLPALGSRLEGGERGFHLEVDGRAIPMLSPVGGEVVALNPDVLEHPELVADPYERGWLMEVRVPKARRVTGDLLSGRRAAAWMNDAVSGLRARMSGDLGMALQDGGVPVSGFARQIAPQDWPALATELFLTGDAPVEDTATT